MLVNFFSRFQTFRLAEIYANRAVNPQFMFYKYIQTNLAQLTYNLKKNANSLTTNDFLKIFLLIFVCLLYQAVVVFFYFDMKVNFLLLKSSVGLQFRKSKGF